MEGWESGQANVHQALDGPSQKDYTRGSEDGREDREVDQGISKIKCCPSSSLISNMYFKTISFLTTLTNALAIKEK